MLVNVTKLDNHACDARFKFGDAVVDCYKGFDLLLAVTMTLVVRGQEFGHVATRRLADLVIEKSK
jgi:hypothetical protein